MQVLDLFLSMGFWLFRGRSAEWELEVNCHYITSQWLWSFE